MTTTNAKRWLGAFILAYLIMCLMLGFIGCKTQQINVTHEQPVTTHEQPVTSGTESSAVVKGKQIFGVNGQIDWNRVSYNNVPFQIAGDSMHLQGIRYPSGTASQFFNYLTDTPSLYSLAMFNSYCKIPATFFVPNLHTSTLTDQLKMLLLAHSVHLFTDTLYVELGNEYVEPHDDKFLNKCATWYNAIKSQYPSAQIGVPGGAPAKWNKKVLARLPDVFLIDHYSNPVDYTKNGITDTVMIDSMMRADKRKYFAGIPANKLWVTEFNLQVAGNVTPPFANDEQKEIAVKFMFKWFANRGVPVVLFHNIVMASGNGTIISDGRGSYLSPTGIAVRDFISSRQ